jgi:predicted anti-sigma-YlaC factor YlaD
MDCATARELISSIADGESTGAEHAAVDAHSECADCAAFATAVERLDRKLRIRPAEAVPDLVAGVTARARPARLGRGGWLRPALAWVAIVMLAQSVPALVFGSSSGTDAHSARHLGAFGAALAIGFVYAAWKPHRAFGLLPFTAALVATTLVSVVADIATGARTPIGELVHVSEIVGLTLLWLIAGSPGRSIVPRRLTRLDPLQ